jgi:hypothetical protein
LLSICENRSCNALDRLVDAGVVVAVDDWPCAASSVLIVAGESWEKPLLPVAGVELAEVVAVLATSNGFVEAESKPVAGGVDDFDEVSDWSASNAVDAAPRANSMGELQQMPHGAALQIPTKASASAVPR